MSELRQDPISGRWVIFAPDRALRPNASRKWPDFDPTSDDPFAEGREAETPGELLADREPGTRPDTPGWRVRVVPNKFPAVELAADRPAQNEFALPEAASHCGYRAAPAVGPHEVIIECPQFETCLSALPLDQVTRVLKAYRDRLRYHREHQTCAHAIVFKNRGIAGGATLAHTHSQLIGTPWIPSAIQEELTRCHDHFTRTGRSLFADVITQELQDGRRLVSVSDQLATWCPYASRMPCEVWIVPQAAGSRFEDLADDKLPPVAAALRTTLQRLHAVMPDLPYNFCIHSAPFTIDAEPWYRWHIEVLPRVGSTAGFEWGGGNFINAVLPETAAQTLRDALPGQ